MNFNANGFAVPIGSDTYTITEGKWPLLNGEGETCFALVDHSRSIIEIADIVPPEHYPQVLAAAVATAWKEHLAQYAADLTQAWDEWSDTIDAIEDPETDADAEDMGLAFAQFSRLRRLGVKFDPAFILRMDEMKEQAMDCTDTFLEDGEDPDPMGGKDSVDDADADNADNNIEGYGCTDADWKGRIEQRQNIRRKAAAYRERASDQLEHGVDEHGENDGSTEDDHSCDEHGENAAAHDDDDADCADEAEPGDLSELSERDYSPLEIVEEMATGRLVRASRLLNWEDVRE